MPNALPISRMVGGYPRSRTEPAMKARISSSRLGAASGSRWAGGTGRRGRPAPFLGGSGFILMHRKILHICAVVKGWGGFCRNLMGHTSLGELMNETVQTIRAEYHLYKALAEAALEQVPEAALSEPGPSDGNSLAAICWHVSGNLESRFTDFLTTDGEKPWRKREEEFATRTVTRADVMAKWNRG